MSIISTIKGWINMILKGKSKDEFNVTSISTDKMDLFIKKCINIYKGNPDWANDASEIKTINFAKSICSEVARLATLAIGIKVEGSARADWLQERIYNSVFAQLRSWVEYGSAYGTVILKPTLDDVVLFTPENYLLTNDKYGAVFLFSYKVSDTEWFTRLEYHRFTEDGSYLIDNVCYKGKAQNDAKHKVSIEDTPWKGILESAKIDGLEKPLYSILRTPQANNIDFNSPLAMPIFAEAIEELKDLDIAYSRNAVEIEDSRRTVLMDSDKLFPFGRSALSEVAQLDRNIASNLMRDKMGLPKYVRMVEGSVDGDSFYKEINPTLNTSTRVEGINALLSQIAYKVGFSNGYFVFNESVGIQTATGVEASQQRTVQFVKDVRDKLQECIDGLLYAMSAMADLYGINPHGEYEVTYDFGDILYNYEEDKARWWAYVQSNKVPAWMYFVKFEGMTEEEAKEMVAEANPPEPMLFNE